MQIISWCKSVMGEPKSRIGALSIEYNLLLAVTKLCVGVLTGSISIIAESVHSAIDLMAAIVAFIAVRIANRSPDGQYNYGYGKAENIGGIIEALLLFVSGILIIKGSVSGIFSGGEIENTGAGVVLMAVTTVTNLVVSRIILHYSYKFESIALEADGVHILVDAYSSAVVLIGIAIIWITDFKILDPIIAICVGLLMVYISYGILKKSMITLMDTSISPEEEQEIIQMLRNSNINGFMGLSKLRTRRSGPDRYIEIYLMFRSNMAYTEAHEICDELEANLAEHFPSIHLLVHAEPYHKLRLVKTHKEQRIAPRQSD